MVAVEIAKRNLFSGNKMDRDGKTISKDCQDVAALDATIQAGAGMSSGKFCKSFGDPRKLTASDHVEDGGDEFIIRVGAIAAALHLDTNAHSAQHEAVSEHGCAGSASCSLSAIRPDSVG